METKILNTQPQVNINRSSCQSQINGNGYPSHQPGLRMVTSGGSLPRSMTLESRSNELRNASSSMNVSGLPVVNENRRPQSTNPSASPVVAGKSGLAAAGSKFNKTIASPCLRKLRSTLSLASRDSRRIPVNASCTDLDNSNELVCEPEESDLNPPLTVRSISSPALHLQPNQPLPSTSAQHYHQHCQPSTSHYQQSNNIPSPCTYYGESVCCSNNDCETLYMRDVCSKYFTHDDQIGLPRPLLKSQQPSCNNYQYHVNHHPINNIVPQAQTCGDLGPQVGRVTCGNPVISSPEDRYRVTYSNEPINGNQSQHRFVEVRRSNESKSESHYQQSTGQSNSSMTVTTANPVNISSKSSSESNEILGQHIVVVSSYEKSDHGLTVKSVQSSTGDRSDHLDSPLDCKTENDLNHMISTSSTDLAYKSSSESGRGTMKSDSSSSAANGASISPPLGDHTSLDSDQSGPPNTNANIVDETSKKISSNSLSTSMSSSNIGSDTLDKMQADLQRILDDDGDLTSDGGFGSSGLKSHCMRLPVVLESDSWVSDSSKTLETPEKKKSGETSTMKLAGTSSSPNNTNLKKDSPNPIPCPNTSTPKKKCSTDKTPTTFGNLSKTSNQLKVKSIKGQATLGKMNGIPKNYKLSSPKKWRLPMTEDTASVTTLGLESVDYGDDLTSEYTANTDAWEPEENVHMRKQLSGLENMYSEILNLLGSRMSGAKKSIHHSSSGKLNRRISGSVSSLSVASRDAFYGRHNKYLHRREDFDSKGARRLKRLEGHVITLARSVSQLSSELRSNQCLVQDVTNLRKDVDRIQEQLKCIKITPLIDNGTLRRNATNMIGESKETEKFRTDIMSNNNKNNKLDKIKRFFGDEPPLIRQFLKKLGYEKYASKFESEKIGLKELLALNEEKLTKLGIPMGPRARIIQELNKLRPPQCNIYLV